jgi:hypothetical protein
MDKVARKPSFSFRKKASGWKVEIPARTSPTGKRQRAFFPTRDEAKDYAAELRNKNEVHCASASLIAPSLADEAQRAVELLKPYGITLLEAARMATEARKSHLPAARSATRLRIS